ncbi:MAG TPA: aminoglycoside phosphotransferase family protein [Candidatus Dojkabacteria bacterium]|nr:aminoglycoside phosphotransferase family protein [Candidatus Dojkabacteria bacterium]
MKIKKINLSKDFLSKNIIDYGRRSTVLTYSSNSVLKLYDKTFPKEFVIQEFSKTLTIFKDTKLHVPKPLEIVEVEKRLGIMYERIVGNSIMNLMMNNVFNYFILAKEVAKVHKEIHKYSVDIETQEDRYSELIKNSKKINKEDKVRLLEILNRKYRPVLCHGDFHHGNIIKNNKGIDYILDWGDSFSGSYLLDVALTSVNAVVSTAPDHVPTLFRSLYEIMKAVLKLDERYLKLYGINIDQAKDYLFLAAAIHLVQNHSETDGEHFKYFEKYKRAIS